MKKLIILLLILLPLTMYSQEQKEPDYKTYKPCTDCFDKWEKSKTGLENYGFSPQTSKDRPARRVARQVFGGIVAIFVGTAVYVLANKATQTANEIH